MLTPFHNNRQTTKTITDTAGQKRSLCALRQATQKGRTRAGRRATTTPNFQEEKQNISSLLLSSQDISEIWMWFLACVDILIALSVVMSLRTYLGVSKQHSWSYNLYVKQYSKYCSIRAAYWSRVFQINYAYPPDRGYKCFIYKKTKTNYRNKSGHSGYTQSLKKILILTYVEWYLGLSIPFNSLNV